MHQNLAVASNEYIEDTIDNGFYQVVGPNNGIDANFKTYRPMDTGDTEHDIKLECDKTYELTWYASNTSSNLSVPYAKTGTFEITFDSDCEVTAMSSAYGTWSCLELSWLLPSSLSCSCDMVHQFEKQNN